MYLIAGVLLLGVLLGLGITLLRRRRLIDRQPCESGKRRHDRYQPAADMFVCLEVEGARVIECSRRLAEALGQPCDELIGEPFIAHVCTDSRPRFREAFRDFQQSGVLRPTELELQRGDGGRLRMVLMAVGVRDRDGKLLHAWAVLNSLRRLDDPRGRSLDRELR
jgi:PAS domain-containing protein